MSSSKSVVWTKNTEIRENFDNKNPLDEPIKGYLETLFGNYKLKFISTTCNFLENNTRYGCNKLKNTPAMGAVPGLRLNEGLVHQTQVKNT